MHPLDALILLAFIAFALYSGMAARRQASIDLDQYFLAGRSLKGWQAGLSMAATQFSADTPLLVTGLIATAGVFSLWRLWVYALAFFLLGFVLAPAWRRARVLTDAELSELRYGSRAAAPLRLFKALYFGVIFNCAVLAMVLVAASRIAEPFLTWDAWLPNELFTGIGQVLGQLGVAPRPEQAPEQWSRSANSVLSVGIILALTTLYSTTGGLRAVVRTDLGQLAIALLGSLLYAIFAMRAAGGWSALPQRLADLSAQRPALLSPRALLAFEPSQAESATAALLAVMALQWLVQMNADGTGYLAQRSMACRTDRDALEASVWFSVTQILVRSLLWLPIAVALLVVLPPEPGLAGGVLQADREASFVWGIEALLPPGVRGILLTALLAALASTIDTHLNWGASYLTNDVYRRFLCQALFKRKAHDRELVRVARFSNLAIIVLSLILMTRLSSIQTAWHLTLLLGAGMGVILVLRWAWWRITAYAELASLATSMLLAPILLVGLPAPGQEPLRLLLMALGSTLAGVAISVWGPAEPPFQLEIFFERARPLGFWAPQARALGLDTGGPRALGRRLLAVMFAAASLFCGVTGLGTALVHGTPPVFLPWRSAWVAALLMAALGLLVLCRRLLRAS